VRSVRFCLGRFGDNGNDVRDIFVSTRYRSELPKTWRRTGVGRGECEMLFGGDLGTMGMMLETFFVSNLYRSELWKMWGGREVGGWKTWRRTGVVRGECQVSFGAIGDNGHDVVDILFQIATVASCGNFGPFTFVCL